MKVLTLNCWGLYVEAKHVKERFEHIAKDVKEYDIVCFQEVWATEDYNDLVTRLASNKPHSHHFSNSSFLGSGLCVFSKYPINSIITHQYRVTGGVRQIHDGEIFAGKGVLCCKLDTPNGTVAVFNTHINPRCRESQLFELMQLVRNVRGNDPVIVCGDFNTKDKYPAYRLMTECLNIKDVYGNESDVWTCDLGTNIYTKPSKVNDSKRIDFIFHSDHFTVESKRLALSGNIPGKDFPYSDHEGVEAVLLPLEVDVTKTKGKMSPNALQTLKVISNLIKSKRDVHYETGSLGVGFVIIILLVISTLLISLSMAWLLEMYSSYWLHWMILPLSSLCGIGAFALFVLVLNDHQLFSGMTANIQEIDAILLYHKQMNSI